MPRHVVVDGSNLATEGRSMPSLKQLNEAVLAYMADHPNDLVTVVVDATFGHRIDPKEVPEFDAAIANNELVAPPAGAIGRGDAFVLSIADKVGAVILSNDSYQEFHGQYDWLFEEGRLVGGKPVPHIGWVFVARVPVRGPVSRKATRSRKQTDATVRLGSKEASRPMPVPKAPPPGRRPAAAAAPEPKPSSARGRGRAAKEAAAHKPAAVDTPTPAKGEPVNALLPFLGFVEAHPVGSRVEGSVESYSSHGAYVAIGDVRGYVPLRLMSSPPPRSARELMKLGDLVTLVVASFHASRRSIDLALEAMAGAVTPAAAAVDVASAARRRAKKGAEPPPTTPAAPAQAERPAAAAKKTATKKTAAKTAGAEKAVAAKKTAAKKAPAERPVAAAKKTAAKKATTAKAATAKATTAKAATAKAATTTKAATTAKASAKAPAKKAVATTAAPTSVPAKKTAAKKTAAKKAATKKAPASKRPTASST